MELTESVRVKKGDTIIADYPKSKNLTHGKLYVVEWVSCGLYVAVKNDQNRTKAYSHVNFKLNN